jgi:hypothetical protein
MSYRVNEFVIESYTNDLGQTLEPGDDVVFVTTCMHRVSVETGKFEGVYRNLSSKKIAGTRIGTVPVNYQERVFCEDGKHEEEVYKGWDQKTWRYIYEKTGRRYNLVPRVKYRKSTLQLNRVFKIETPLAKVSI